MVRQTIAGAMYMKYRGMVGFVLCVHFEWRFCDVNLQRKCLLEVNSMRLLAVLMGDQIKRVLTQGSENL